MTLCTGIDDQVEIFWDESINEHMTMAKSLDPVLRDFFTINDWHFIKNIYQDVMNEKDVDYLERSILFYKEKVRLMMGEESSELEKPEFFRIIAHLFDLMIVGANDDHHGVRYEPWWQGYTEVNFRLQHKVRLGV